MGQPIVKTDANVTFNLELDAQTVSDLEQAVSYSIEYGPDPSPRLLMVLGALKEMVKRLNIAAPYLRDFSFDVVDIELPKPPTKKLLTDAVVKVEEPIVVENKDAKKEEVK